MKKALLLTGVLLALTASFASAAGLNMGWHGATTASGCPTGVGNTVDYTDPCDGGGFAILVGSAVVNAGLVNVTGEECIVDVQVGNPAGDSYWTLDSPGGCRNSSLLCAASFPTSPAAVGFSTAICKNYWGTNASGGQNWVNNFGAPNRYRLDMVFAVSAAASGPMVAGTQYYLFQAALDGQHALPLSDPANDGKFCAGCSDVGCLVFNYALITQPVGVGDQTYTSASTRNYATFNGGGIAAPGCPQATPAHKASWGQVKSLYR